jgi:acyl carrier protein
MDLKAEIRKYIIENFFYGQDDGSLDDDVSFLGTGIIDSTGVLELVSFVQETYGIRVTDDELIPDNFDSLNKLESFIGKKRATESRERREPSQPAISAN